MKLRSLLYRSARVLGDVQAAQQGPGAFVKRRVRRKAYGASARLTRALLRSGGVE